ncbi:6528_t:CDS:2 [Ambispora leptoticha]|uniref:6528_t:CDS:1 n=1 Tax=Ambispora leptoticha TaxID=144679 RepID=A0A9N8WG46_9GLOM|nr:6528_t:CDS:2 [Ambispora leptoticha]
MENSSQNILNTLSNTPGYSLDFAPIINSKQYFEFIVKFWNILR